MFNPEALRYGSAGFADAGAIARAGLHAGNGLYIGHDELRRPCYSAGQAGVLLCGGARSGKGNFILPWQIDGAFRGSVINMDPKGQNGAIAQLQALQGRRVVNFNPRGTRGVASHRINPVSYLNAASPSLIPDAKFFAASWIPLTGAPNAEYFEGNAQRITEAVTVTMARLKGSVSLPELADTIGGLGAATERWLAFEFEMTQSPDQAIRDVAGDLATWRKSDGGTGGFHGIKNEIAKAFSCMTDPQLRASLSPPFDFCFSEMTAPGAPPYVTNIMEAQEFMRTSGPVLKSLYTAAMIYKRRALDAREQLWCLDEIGNIGAWPLAIELFAYGPGFGIRPVAVVQSTAQLDNLAPRASEILTNSCGTQIYMGTRALQQASLVSQLIGTATLEYDDFVEQERARQARREAVSSIFLEGADPFSTMMGVAHQQRIATHRAKQARLVRTPDEVINEPQGRAFVFMPGVLEKPFHAVVPRYWHRRDLAGRYLGDPFHSPPGRVEIATFRGQAMRRIITEAAPAKYADWPQYRRSGQWSYVEGFRP